MPRGSGREWLKLSEAQDWNADNNSNHSQVFVCFFLLFDDRPSPVWLRGGELRVCAYSSPLSPGSRAARSSLTEDTRAAGNKNKSGFVINWSRSNNPSDEAATSRRICPRVVTTRLRFAAVQRTTAHLISRKISCGRVHSVPLHSLVRLEPDLLGNDERKRPWPTLQLMVSFKKPNPASFSSI
jgi:hypothetical protein